MYFVNLSAGDEEFHPNPSYDGRLMPPPLRLRTGVALEQFSSELPSIFDKATEIAEDDEDKNRDAGT